MRKEIIIDDELILNPALDTATKKLLMILIMNECFKNNNNCITSNKDFAELLNIKYEQNVSKIINELKDANLINISLYTNNNGKTSRCIHLNSDLCSSITVMIEHNVNTDRVMIEHNSNARALCESNSIANDRALTINIDNNINKDIYNSKIIANDRALPIEESKNNDIDINSEEFKNDFKTLSIFNFNKKYSKNILAKEIFRRYPNEALAEKIFTILDSKYSKSVHLANSFTYYKVLVKEIGYCLDLFKRLYNDDKNKLYKVCSKFLEEAINKNLLDFKNQDNSRLESWRQYYILETQKRIIK